MKCKSCIKYTNIISCTIDDEGKHHSCNDQPAQIYKNGTKHWYKHGMWHRENGPSAIVNHNYNNDFYDYWWHYEGKIWISTKSKPKDNIITIDNYDYGYKVFCNKVAIVLKHMKKYDLKIYFCLIENEKRYVKCI